MRKPLAILALLLATPARADDGLPDPAAVSAALDAWPGVEAAQQRTRAARAEADARAAGPHEFTFSGSWVHRSVDREGSYDEYDASLTRAVRWPGKVRLDRSIGRFGIEAAQNRAEDARHQAALVLAQEWWDWLGAAREAVIDRQAVDNAAAMLAGVRRRVALRDAAPLDADQAEAMLGMAKVAAEQSAGREKVARVRLTTHFPALVLPATAPEIPPVNLPAGGLAPYRDHVLARSHEIAAAEAELGRADSLAARARQERLADPAIGVRLFSERGGAERGAGVVLSMPLGGSHRRALAEQAQAEAGAVRSEARAVRIAVAETAAADIAETEYRYAAWARARESLNAQVAALQKLRRGHQAGEIDLSDLLLGERQVHEAFRTEATTRAEAQRALTRLRIDSHELWIGEDGEK